MRNLSLHTGLDLLMPCMDIFSPLLFYLSLFGSYLTMSGHVTMILLSLLLALSVALTLLNRYKCVSLCRSGRKAPNRAMRLSRSKRFRLRRRNMSSPRSMHFGGMVAATYILALMLVMLTQGLLVFKCCETCLLVGALFTRQVNKVMKVAGSAVCASAGYASSLTFVRPDPLSMLRVDSRLCSLMVFMVLIEGVGAAGGEANANRVPMVSIPAAIAAGCAGSEWVGHMFHKPRTGKQRMSFLRVAE